MKSDRQGETSDGFLDAMAGDTQQRAATAVGRKLQVHLVHDGGNTG